MTTRGCTEEDFKTIGGPAFLTRPFLAADSVRSHKFACNRYCYKSPGQETMDGFTYK